MRPSIVDALNSLRAEVGAEAWLPRIRRDRIGGWTRDCLPRRPAASPLGPPRGRLAAPWRQARGGEPRGPRGV